MAGGDMIQYKLIMSCGARDFISKYENYVDNLKRIS